MFNYELPDLTKLTVSDIEGNSPLQEYIAKQLLALLTQKQNLHGRRIGKAKDAINPGDYVTKRQLNGTLVGLLSARPQPSNVVIGTTYFATDRNVTYIQRGGHWYYYSGIQNVTLNPDTKPSPSILYDTGYMIYATDFDWYYRWNLVTWQRLGGVNRNIEGFQVAPTKAGWGLCDGSTYNCSTDSGGITTVATQNLNGIAAFVKFGSSYIASIAAVAPTISGITGNQNANHFHNVTASGTVTGNIPAHAHILLDNLIDGGLALISHAVFLDGTAWVIHGTNSGNTGNNSNGHTHSVTASGTIVGNIPNHKHIIDGDADGGTGKVAVSHARTGSGTGSAWTVTGTNSGNTGNTDVDHRHYNTNLCVEVGGPDDSTSVDDFSGGTDVASASHHHIGVANGFSDYIISGLSHSHSGSSITWTSTSAEHQHNLEGETGILTTSVANGLTFSGGSVTSGGESTTHNHSGSSISWASTSEDHFHLITGYTETTIKDGPIALSLTFTGSPVSSTTESSNHQHSGASLTVSNTGTPLAVQLIPYIRL